jgi:uncharacterized NAD(P)/FAD-binding protein YdhS
MSGARPTVAIVGGGFSGAAVAHHLARAGVSADIVVFEPRERLGGGLAYGGDDPVHRVNVPASRMSVLPEDEAHFVRWLDSSGALAQDPEARVGADLFPRRRDFGRYVEAALRPFIVSGVVRHVRDRVERLAKDNRGWRLVSARGDTLGADLVVIATTHPTARLPSELEPLRGEPRLVVDSLVDRALQYVGKTDRVLIVGAGLTAADLVAALHTQGHAGPIVMISRRGLRSRGHPEVAFPAEGDFVTQPLRSATALLAEVRRAIREANAAGRSWHSVLDALRAQGGDIWRALGPDARRRVVRHLRPFWDAHRFRIAPQIETVLNAKLRNGSLQLLKARLGAVQRDAQGFAVQLRDGRRRAPATHRFDWIVVATGPAHGDILRTQRLFSSLAEAGVLVLDDTGLGLKTSREARAIGADGRANSTLFIAGPLARGTFGELMGLPQVSAYAQFVASQVEAALAALRLPEPASSRSRPAVLVQS